MLALDVVKLQPGADTGLGFGHGGIGMEVDLLVFGAAPQSLDKDVVRASALAVHADRDPTMLEHAGEFAAGELAALILNPAGGPSR